MKNKLFSMSYKTPQEGRASRQTNQTQAVSTSPAEQVFMHMVAEATAKPQPLTDIEKLITSSGTELRSFYAGSEYSYRRGFDAGYGRALIVGFIAGIAFLAISSAGQKTT